MSAQYEYREFGKASAKAINNAILKAQKISDVELDKQQGEQPEFTARLMSPIMSAGYNAEEMIGTMGIRKKSTQNFVKNTFNGIEVGADVTDSLANISEALANATDDATKTAESGIADLKAFISETEAVYEYGNVGYSSITLNELPVSTKEWGEQEMEHYKAMEELHNDLKILEKLQMDFTEKLAQAEEAGEDTTEIKAELNSIEESMAATHDEISQKEVEHAQAEDAWVSSTEELNKIIEAKNQTFFTFSFLVPQK